MAISAMATRKNRRLRLAAIEWGFEVVAKTRLGLIIEACDVPAEVSLRCEQHQRQVERDEFLRDHPSAQTIGEYCDLLITVRTGGEVAIGNAD